MKLVRALLLFTALIAVSSASASHFNGTFVGAHLGGSKTNTTKSSTNSSGQSFSTLGGYQENKKWDINGGVLVGHRSAISSHYVTGATIGMDFEGTHYKNSISSNSANGKAQRKFIVNALGQLGYTWKHNIMPYVTAGLSYTQFKVDNTDSAGSSSKLKNKLGWAAGLGVAHAFNTKVSADVQYLYTKYGRSGEASQTSVGGRSYTTFTPRAYHAVTVGVKVNI